MKIMYIVRVIQNPIKHIKLRIAPGYLSTVQEIRKVTFQEKNLGGFRELNIEEMVAVSGGIDEIVVTANKLPDDAGSSSGGIARISGASEGNSGFRNGGSSGRPSVTLDVEQTPPPPAEPGPVTFSCCNFSALGFELDIDLFSIDIENAFRDQVVVEVPSQ